MIFATSVESFCGRIFVESDGNAITRIAFAGTFRGKKNPLPHAVPADEAESRCPPLRRAREQLAEYFAGTRRAFDLPLAESAGTPFSREVRAALEKIPFGETRAYGEIAAELGRPRAARAVGAACRANPFQIVVPCHRVVGGNDALTGYAGGLGAKLALLDFERRAGPFLICKKSV